MSYLEIFKENARQFNEALATAKRTGKAVVQFTTCTGVTVRRYWNGATFTDRARELHEDKYMRGELVAEFELKGEIAQ